MVCVSAGRGICRLQGQMESELLDLSGPLACEWVAAPHVAGALWRSKPGSHDDHSAVLLLCHLQPHQAAVLLSACFCPLSRTHGHHKDCSHAGHALKPPSESVCIPRITS